MKFYFVVTLAGNLRNLQNAQVSYFAKFVLWTISVFHELKKIMIKYIKIFFSVKVTEKKVL